MLIVVGVVLLVLGGFIPAPGARIANICGAVMLAIGLVLLLLSLLGYAVTV